MIYPIYQTFFKMVNILNFLSVIISEALRLLAPTKETYHDYVKEIYDGIPHVRDIDPDMQSENSYWAIMARKERM